MEENLPELVRDWKLETTFRNNQTVHTRFITNPTKEQWRSRIEEIWQRKQQLGCGGFGVVWLEECMSGSGTGQVRAVKQLRKAMSPSWPKELEAVFKFSHPRYRDSFIESFGWFDNEDDVCITMEYCPLGDLAKCVARPLPESEASLVTVQILEGVKYMHENNFTHRDLKPSNILVLHQGPKWWIKICDFGISKRTEGTSLWTQVGTEAYLAPEIRGLYTPSDMPVRGNKIFSLAVDIWAIGVIAHFISTGRMPFQDTMELIRYVQGTPFPDDSSLSTDCRTFMAETMKASPKQRPTAKDALSFAWLQQHLGTTNPNIDHLIQDVSNMHLQNRGDPYMLTPASGQWSTLNLLSPPSGELIPRPLDSPSIIPTRAAPTQRHTPLEGSRSTKAGRRRQSGIDSEPEQSLKSTITDPTQNLREDLPISSGVINLQAISPSNPDVLRDEDPKTLRSIYDLAWTYGDQGRWKEAEKLFSQVAETRKRVLGDEDPDTLRSMQGLARAYKEQGRRKEAEKLFSQVAETRKRVSGDEDPDTLRNIHNLAWIYGEQGRWKEAEKLYL